MTHSLKLCEQTSDNNLKGNKLHLIGEYHHKFNNEKLQLTYLQLLHQNGIFPKYFIMERGSAHSYIFNKYFLTEDESLLDLVFILKSDKDLFKELHKYRCSLEDDKKFEIAGVDYNDYVDLVHFVIKDLLLSNLHKKDSTLYNKVIKYNNYANSDSLILNLAVSFKLKERPQVWDWNALRKDLKRFSGILESTDSLQLLNVVGEDIKFIKDVLQAYEEPLKNKNLYSQANQFTRDKYMAGNIYGLLSRDSNVVMIGQLGSAHVQKRWPDGKINLAYLLNNDPSFRRLNNRVFTNTIIYKTFPNRIYKSLNLSKKETKKIFSEMKEKGCKVYFQKYKDSTIVDNLIYLDNIR
jgi:hypothetical protein